MRWAARVLTVFAAASFLLWLRTLQPFALLGALAFAGGAYAFFLVDRERILAEIRRVERHPSEPARPDTEVAVSPQVSAGGIHLSYVTHRRR